MKTDMRRPVRPRTNPELPERLRRYVDDVGMSAAVRHTGVCRETLTRIVAGLRVRPGSAALVELRLCDLETTVSTTA